MKGLGFRVSETCFLGPGRFLVGPKALCALVVKWTGTLEMVKPHVLEAGLQGGHPHIIKAFDDCRWEEIEVKPYKEDGGTHFKSISRQTLFGGDSGMPIELRYFEIEPGGHSTLERHDHLHLVMIIKGQGRVFVKDEVHPLSLQDVVHIPAQTWHQFQPTGAEPLGFVCLVMNERDRPHRPTEEEFADLIANPAARDFLKI